MSKMSKQEHNEAADEHLRMASHYEMEGEAHEVARLNVHRDEPLTAAPLEDLEAKARDAHFDLMRYHNAMADRHRAAAAKAPMTCNDLAERLNNTGGAFPAYVGKGKFEWVNVAGPGGSDDAPAIEGLELDICNDPVGMKLCYIASVGAAEAWADPENGLWLPWTREGFEG